MQIILATLGTDGDVIPHLGLGTLLRERGHRVTIAAPETYQDRAVDLKLEFVTLVTNDEVNRMLKDPDLWHPYRSGLMMARWGAPMILGQYEILSGLIQQPDAVLVVNPGVLAGRLVQETLGCPTASLLLQPGLLPSNTAPPVMTGGLTIPGWFPVPLRNLFWGMIDAVGYVLVLRSLNPVRKKLGLRPVRRLFQWWLSPDLVIGLFPEWYAAPQPDWPPQLRMAGFGKYDGTRDELAEEIREFCESGSPPILFTMGTGMMHSADFFQEAVAACEIMGSRGLLLTKYSDLVPRELPATIRHCRFAPFHSLLPKCGAIVHHGGIGTTAAALAAGCPQLILPLAWDQPDNATRVSRLGVGTSLGMRHRTRGDLVKALSSMMNGELRSRCRQIASQAAACDGLQVAADWIEALSTCHPGPVSRLLN